MDGLELRRYIIEDTLLQKGKIPFVFLSTSTEYNLVETAFQLGIQGYFQKPNNYNSMRKVAHAIITYWANSSFIPAGNSFASPAARKSST
jgi:CheY-like chemotaxis protein